MKIRFFPVLCSLAVLILGGAGSLSAAPVNIVVILADDLGYGDVQALNPKSKIPTPHLNRLAEEGMTFTDAHSPSAVCTPTRYGLLTGRYCWRTRLKRGVLNGYGTPLIWPNRETIASFLKKHGYATGIVGKWHLGLQAVQVEGAGRWDFTKPLVHGPKQLGFDFSYIIPASLDFPPYVYIRDGQFTRQPDLKQKSQRFPAFLRAGPRSPDFVMEDCLDHLLDQAKGFIKRQADNRNQPFFLYFPLTAPHKPVLPHSRFHGKTKLGPYGDFVVQVDWTVGQILKELQRRGIERNTLLLFTSDNGSFMYRYEEKDQKDHVDDATVQGYRPEHHTANHDLRGTKADVWEAGHRVPFFAWWPAGIQEATRCHETISLTDVFATVAGLIGKPVPDGAAEDSFDMTPLLKGKTWAVPRDPVIHHSAAGMFAVRRDKWKLVLGNGSGGRERPRGKPFEKPYALFDMEKDRSEKRNVAAEHPEVVAELEAALQKIR